MSNADKTATGTTGGSIYAKHKHTPGKTTRYWFKVNPGKNNVADVNIGVHNLITEAGEEGKNEWYVDDAWMVNLNKGTSWRETFVQDKGETMRNDGTKQNLTVKAGDLVMIEIRDGKLGLWIDWKYVNESVFTDKELGKEGLYAVIEFENSSDGDIVQYLGYDEKESSEPAFVPPPVVAPAGGKKTPEKKPSPQKKADPAKK